MYSSFNGPYFAVIVIIIVVVVWGGIWKAIALWRAGRDNNLAWFAILCMFITFGILDISYIFAISRPNRARELPQWGARWARFQRAPGDFQAEMAASEQLRLAVSTPVKTYFSCGTGDRYRAARVTVVPEIRS